MRFKWILIMWGVLLTLCITSLRSSRDVTTVTSNPNELATSPEINLLSLATEPATEPSTEPAYVEQFPEVPLYFQTDYPQTPYGAYGTVATHGCGITCLAMVLSYQLDTEILPDELAAKYGRYNTEVGSSWMLFPDSAKDYGLTIQKQTWCWADVWEALQNGQVVIANAHEQSVFTDGGHFIVLYGITPDGKVLVRDPYERNYTGKWSEAKEGLENGFEHSAFRHCFPMWIYEPKVNS